MCEWFVEPRSSIVQSSFRSPTVIKACLRLSEPEASCRSAGPPAFMKTRRASKYTGKLKRSSSILYSMSIIKEQRIASLPYAVHIQEEQTVYGCKQSTTGHAAILSLSLSLAPSHPCGSRSGDCSGAKNKRGERSTLPMTLLPCLSSNSPSEPSA